MSTSRKISFFASSKRGLGVGDEVDVAQAAVGLAKVFEAFADCGVIEPVPVLDGELGPQGALVS